MITDIGIRSILVEDQNIIFSAKDYNFIGKLNLNSSKIEYLTQIPGRNLCEDKLTSKIIRWREWLILLPYFDCNISMWNEVTNDWCFFKVAANNEKAFFYEGYVINDTLYAFSPCDKNIVIINLVERKKIERLSVFDDEREYYFGLQGECINGIIYMPDYLSSRVLKFDTILNIFSWIEIKNRCKGGFVAINAAGEHLYIAPSFGKDILVWDMVHQQIEMEFSEQLYEKQYYLGIKGDIKGRIIAVSGYAAEYLLIEKNSICLCNTEASIEIIKEGYNDEFWIVDNKGNLFLLDRENCIRRIEFKINIAEAMKWNKAYFSISKLLIEGEEFDLEDYLALANGITVR